MFEGAAHIVVGERRQHLDGVGNRTPVTRPHLDRGGQGMDLEHSVTLDDIDHSALAQRQTVAELLRHHETPRTINGRSHAMQSTIFSGHTNDQCATLTYMERVGVRALQQNASAVVARAAAGEVIEITDRGRPVAQIVPLARLRLDALAAAGMARPARRRASEMPRALPKRKGSADLGELVAEARADER